jgi:FlaA1/EpsC-like NDP-sugar epimerase
VQTMSKQNTGYFRTSSDLFKNDLFVREAELNRSVRGKRFLVVGGAGTIGSAVANEIIKRGPEVVHIVDISENNLVETVRYLRSSGSFDSELLTFAIDVGGKEFEALIEHAPSYDYILNLSALKHVRSEKDPYTLNRLLDVNIFNAARLAKIASEQQATKYFCVSTDKAANPANAMGASKRLMELFLLRESERIDISFARFANVAYSDGSLPHGFTKRFDNGQPISAPKDIRRYFISSEEAGQLCLLSTLLGENLDIFFPKLTETLHEATFKDMAIDFLEGKGFEAFECASEEEARKRCTELIAQKKWPCYFFESDTSGEKAFEEFYTPNEEVVLNKFEGVGIVRLSRNIDLERLDAFEASLSDWRESGSWDRDALIEILKKAVPEFEHVEKGKNLDQRM